VNGWEERAAGAMDDFISTYVNRLDAKGRVSIPAPFRAILQVDGADSLYCCPTLRGDAVDAGGSRFRATIRAMLESYPPFSEDHELLSTTLIGESEMLKIDVDGRVNLSESIKAATGISDRATFVGQGFKFQIWEPDRFAVYRSEARNRLRETRIGQAPVHRAAGANTGAG